MATTFDWHARRQERGDRVLDQSVKCSRHDLTTCQQSLLDSFRPVGIDSEPKAVSLRASDERLASILPPETTQQLPGEKECTAYCE
jgi:hypothetical protein